MKLKGKGNNEHDFPSTLSDTELTRESVETLDDDEHVVDADAEEEEGHDGMGRAVEEAEDGAEPVADDDAHPYPEDPADTEEDLLLDTVQPAQHH